MRRHLTILIIGDEFALYVNDSLHTVQPEFENIVEASQGQAVTLGPVQNWTGVLTEFPADKRSLGDPPVREPEPELGLDETAPPYADAPVPSLPETGQGDPKD